MLGKLFKHELKVTTKQFVPIIGILFIYALLSRFVFWNILESSNLNMFLTAITGFLQILFYLLIFAFFLVTFVLCVQRFYKHVLTDQGYLTLTLPVKTWQILLSKGTVATFWTILNSILGVLFVGLSIPESEIIRDMIDVFTEVIPEMASGLQVPTGLLIFELILTVLISTFSSYFFIYACISLGQSFRNHRVIGAFVVYFIASFVLQIITSIALATFLQFPIYETAESVGRWLHSLMIAGTLKQLLLAVGGFAFSNYYINNKLDLQ